MLRINTEPDSLLQLVYASAATVPFSEQDLDDLLTLSRSNNAKRSLSGVLLYRNETFLQVLEGPSGAVLDLFDRISHDERHARILLLASEVVPRRSFDGWSMGFERRPDAIDQIPGFVDFFTDRTFLDLLDDNHRMRQVLDGFRRGRWQKRSRMASA